MTRGCSICTPSTVIRLRLWLEGRRDYGFAFWRRGAFCAGIECFDSSALQLGASTESRVERIDCQYGMGNSGWRAPDGSFTIGRSGLTAPAERLDSLLASSRTVAHPATPAAQQPGPSRLHHCRLPDDQSRPARIPMRIATDCESRAPPASRRDIAARLAAPPFGNTAAPPCPGLHRATRPSRQNRPRRLRRAHRAHALT